MFHSAEKPSKLHKVFAHHLGYFQPAEFSAYSWAEKITN